LQKEEKSLDRGKVKGVKFKCLQDDGFPTQLKAFHHCVKHAMGTKGDIFLSISK